MEEKVQAVFLYIKFKRIYCKFPLKQDVFYFAAENQMF